MICFSGQTALFLFHLAKEALEYLPTALSVELRPPFLLARRVTLRVPSAIPCSLSPLISRIHSCLFSDWRRTVSSKFFDTQVPSISTEELVLPRHARCVLSRLRCNGHSLLLSSYLSRISRIENSSCSACGHSSQDTSNLILHCPSTDSMRHSLFGDSLFLFDLWSRSWGVARLLGLHGLPPCPHPSEGVGNNNNTLFLHFSESSLELLLLLLRLSLSCKGILLAFFCCCSLYFPGAECGLIFHSF